MTCRQKMKLDTNMTAFWALEPCDPAEVDPRFRGAFSLNHQGDDPMMETRHL
jgi:hypothetical protein